MAQLMAYNLPVRLNALAKHAVERLGDKAAIRHERSPLAQGLPTRTDQAAAALVERDNADPGQGSHVPDLVRGP